MYMYFNASWTTSGSVQPRQSVTSSDHLRVFTTLITFNHS